MNLEASDCIFQGYMIPDIVDFITAFQAETLEVNNYLPIEDCHLLSSNMPTGGMGTKLPEGRLSNCGLEELVYTTNESAVV